MPEFRNGRGFDRVLTDVPCSGDATIRKAADILHRWQPGIGNGLHNIQLNIGIRGLELLKVGGIMAYSTCTFNPIENEAVVAELLRRANRAEPGSVRLLDNTHLLPGLRRRQGLSTWSVAEQGI